MLNVKLDEHPQFVIFKHRLGTVKRNKTRAGAEHPQSEGEGTRNPRHSNG